MEPVPRLESGRELVAVGRYAEAAPLLERWVEVGSPSGEDWLDLARARLGIGDRDASRALDRAARLLPASDPRVPLERGRILWRLDGDLPGARAAFAEALTKDRAFQEAREERVRMLLDARAPKAFEGERLDPVGLAEEDVAFLETQRPDDARGPLLRGVLELRRGDFGKAAAAGEASARLDSDMAEGLLVVGEARGRTAWSARTKGEHAAATESYRAAERALGEAIARASRKPEHRSQGRLLNEAYLARAQVRLRLDDTEGMLADERARLALRPAGAESLHAEAEANRQAGRWEDAIRLYELLLEIAPNRDVGFNLAFCHQMLGDGSAAYGDFAPAVQRYRRAIDLYTKYRSIAPTDAMFHAYRGECWVRVARLEPASREEALAKAKADFDEGLRLATEAGGGAPSEVLVRRCAWSSAVGDVDGALADIRAAIGDDKSKNPRFYATLALCDLGVAAKALREGRRAAVAPLLAEALTTLESVLTQSAPSRPTALKLRALARLLQADLGVHASRSELRAQAEADATASAKDEAAYGLGVDEALLYAAEARILAKGETPAVRAASDARLEGMASGRWTPPAAYYERLAEALDAAGEPDDAARARRRAAILPR